MNVDMKFLVSCPLCCYALAGDLCLQKLMIGCLWAIVLADLKTFTIRCEKQTPNQEHMWELPVWPVDAGQWLVISAGAKEILVAWMLQWQLQSHGWVLMHSWLSTRPPPNR